MDRGLPERVAEGERRAVPGSGRCDLDRARPLYKALHPLLRWDFRTEFVQAIKLSMDLVGRHGGPCRHPRLPLTEEQEKAVRAATEAVAYLESDA